MFNVEQQFSNQEMTNEFEFIKYPGVVNYIRQWALSYWRSVFQPDENNKTF